MLYFLLAAADIRTGVLAANEIRESVLKHPMRRITLVHVIVVNIALYIPC